MPVLIDTHAHLNDSRFESDRELMLDRAKNAGVLGVVTIGIDVETSRECLSLAEQYPLLWAAVGIHPNHTAEAHENDWSQIVELSQHPRVIAIGESGLDRYWKKAPLELQEEFFRKHLALAREKAKPIIIHCREAASDVVRVLRDEFEQNGPITGIMHSFCEDEATAQHCLAMGLHISFSGILTYKTAESIRQVARMIPLERLLIETDCPYLSPVPYRGQRNEPAFVAHTAQQLATIREMTIEQIGQITTDNARRLFQI